MKALVVGGKGQLGRALATTAPEGVEVVSHGSDTLDVTDRLAVESLLGVVRPAFVMNAAAYTAVDKAESDEARAWSVNATAVGHLAEAARTIGARFTHVSTDFVFDGKTSTPYTPESKPNPISAYGRTKLRGEELAGSDALIVRTAWLYGPSGGNFVRTMLRLMAEQTEVRVVADQIGSPTYAPGLAAALWGLTGRGASGIYHFTDSGVASWYDFAIAIQEEAIEARLLTQAVPIVPIATADFPAPAKRPSFSVLDKSSTSAALGEHAPHWRSNLRLMIGALRMEG